MAEAAVRALNLSKTFAGRGAVSDVSFEIGAGEVVALVGANGAGKTTLLRLVLGLLRPSEGRAEVLGSEAADAHGVGRRGTGFVLEAAGLYDDVTVWDNLAYYAAIYRLEGWAARARALVEEYGLAGRERDAAGSLSHGMRQKLALCRALLPEPRLLVLDEPSTGLDPRAQIEFQTFMRRMRAAGRTVLVSSHNLTEVEESATRVMLMDQGRVVCDRGMDEILSPDGVEVEVCGFSTVEERDRALAAAERKRVVALPVRANGCEVMVNGEGSRRRWEEALGESGVEPKSRETRGASLRGVYHMLVEGRREWG